MDRVVVDDGVIGGKTRLEIQVQVQTEHKTRIT